ncbi:MAG: CinA family protein [Candidatus Poseidoniales archaeon]
MPSPRHNMDADVHGTAARLARRLKAGGHTITLAESCTGGLLASTLTDIAGSSEWFNQSWITYANAAKMRELGVQEATLAKHGAVSAHVAIEMAKGALERAHADYAISITGIAGPTADLTSKQVGTVYVGIASHSWTNAEHTQIGGTRSENKEGFVYFALLKAIEHFDQAMENAKKAKEAALKKEEELKQKAIKFEQERAAREQAARESAPWQDEAWSEAGKKEADIASEITWQDSEE